MVTVTRSDTTPYTRIIIQSFVAQDEDIIVVSARRNKNFLASIFDSFRLFENYS
jgi:hypothetical protein